ncbi:hypothetical protein, partial [Escherichia coli]|uniref:hypothetical protein n=1 Tax=Escherichia coli TaxID=562 RepID=UPI001BC85BA7
PGSDFRRWVWITIAPFVTVGQGKKLFRWRLPEGNPYLRTETRNTYTSRFTEVAMAFASI